MNNEPTDNEGLTPPEQEILRLAREGLSNNQIAEQLGLKHNAVRFHLKNLHAKLLTDGQRASLAGRARERWGWLPFAFTGWVAPTAGVVAVVAVSVGGYLGVQAADQSHGARVVDARNSGTAIETMVLPATQPTLAEIAQQCHLDLATLRQLNPDIKEPLTWAEAVIVPVNDHCQAGEAMATPGAADAVPEPLGGNAALFGTFADAASKPPTMSANVEAISPGYQAMVKQNETRTIDRRDPHGACAQISIDRPAQNFLWLRMAFDNIEVTPQLTFVAHSPDETHATMCYAPPAGFEPGTHAVSIVVIDPAGGQLPTQRVAWTFNVTP